MEALKRDVAPKILKEITLEDGTVVAIKAKKAKQLVKNLQKKDVDQYTIGIQNMVENLLVKTPDENEFKPIVLDDLLECFSDAEFLMIQDEYNKAMGVKEKNV